MQPKPNTSDSTWASSIPHSTHTRRQFLKAGAALSAFPFLTREALGQGEALGRAVPAAPKASMGVLVNDIHSQLNATRVERIVRPREIGELQAAVREVRTRGGCLSICGSRHSMGGQQFGEANVLVDMRTLNRVIGLDHETGTVEVEAGIEWPKLMERLTQAQLGRTGQWGIVQKQTGADRLSIGGALASNVHGRGLSLKPLISNVESFVLVNAEGEALRCSRAENRELFRLAVGGYGLFGVVASVRLRLTPRRKVERVVQLRETRDIIRGFEARIGEGCLYGDYQFATDSKRDSFLRRGIFSCYRPVHPGTPLTRHPVRFNPEDWARLTYWTHKSKRRAFDFYSKRYLATSGQVYWSDSQLSAAYVDNYHQEIDRKTHARTKATEMITEIYVPRSALADFMEDARTVLREHKANVVYGTVRLIEKDDESFLCWARESYACVIFNLHTVHDAPGLEQAAQAFRALIDLGIRRGGSYYLTYHRWATRTQVENCYPQFAEFLRLKLQHDPLEIFQSNWYRHYRAMLVQGDKGIRDEGVQPRNIVDPLTSRHC